VHGLRHTYATELANSEVSVYTLMKLLGHESMATSQRYVAGAAAKPAPPPRKTRSTASSAIADIGRKSLMAAASTTPVEESAATLRQGAPRSRCELCTDW
jgi:hypothetical protein